MLDTTDATCRDYDNDLFAGPSGGRLDAASVEKAIAICAGCPIKAACLEDALSRSEFDVVRGGVYFDTCGTPSVEDIKRKPIPTHCAYCQGPIGDYVINKVPRSYCKQNCRKRAYAERQRVAA